MGPVSSISKSCGNQKTEMERDEYIYRYLKCLEKQKKLGGGVLEKQTIPNTFIYVNSKFKQTHKICIFYNIKELLIFSVISLKLF